MLKMNNLTVHQSPSPFSFLTTPPTKSAPNGCGGLAWMEASFHLGGANYFIYACPQGERQIKKGKQPKECLIWGGQNV